MLFDVLALTSLIITIAFLRKLVNFFPYLMTSMFRGKENIHLTLSTKLSRDRNILASAMILPFCLTVYRFGIYSPDFMTGMSDDARICITIGVFLTYILIRTVLKYVLSPRSTTAAAYNAGAVTAHTYFIILTLLLLAFGGTMTFLDISNDIIRSTMIWLSGFIYLILLFRKIQIFASSYDYITVFLYLCALEIIPTGVLIVSGLIL